MSVPLTKETFLPLVNTKFKVTFDAENEYELELIEVHQNEKISSTSPKAFSLLFRGPKESKIFDQQMCTLNATATGSIQLFLIPRAPDDDGIYYEAIFN